MRKTKVKAQKIKTSAAVGAVPQDDDAVRLAIRKLGDKQRDVLRLDAEMNDKIAKLQQEYGDKVAPLKGEMEALRDGIQIYCEANRTRLTNGGKVKHHCFATGDVSWRNLPAKVSIKGKASVIEEIKAAGLADQFLRVKEDVNKEAMLENPEAATAIKGVSIGSAGEDFIIEPRETDLKEAS